MQTSEDWNIPRMPIFLIMWGKLKKVKPSLKHTHKRKPTKNTNKT